MTVKKVVSVLLVTVMLFGAAPLNGFVDLELFGIRASAVEETETTISGTIGTKLSWEIDKATKVLTIDNNGAMVSFASDDAPWRNYKSYFNSVVVNEGCTNISQNAFYGCKNIVSVDLPETLETIGIRAFYYCSLLKDITIPDNVISLESYAFNSCSSLENIVIPENVTALGYGSFCNCSLLSSVTFESTNLYIGASAFSNCDSLSAISFEFTSLYIDSSAFYDCDALTSVTVNCSASGNYNSIGDQAFYSCDNLESAIISVGIDLIESEAFANCPKLEKVTIYNKDCSIAETAISIYSTIYGFTGSTAETFANTYGYNFVSIDTPCEHTYSNDCDTSCNVCGETRETGAHNYGEWSVTKEATCSQTGLKEHTCSICSKVEKEVIAILDHTDEDDNGVCDICDKQFRIDYAMHGICGDNLTWTLDDEGVLTIEGTGDMYNFDTRDYILIPDGTGDFETTTRYPSTNGQTPDDPELTTAVATEAPPTQAPSEVPSEPLVTLPPEETNNINDPNESTNSTLPVPHPGENYTTYPYYDEPSTEPYSYEYSNYSEESTTAGVLYYDPAYDYYETTTAAFDETLNYESTNEYVTDFDLPEIPDPQDGYKTIVRWNQHFDKIKKVVIKEGVTSIGDFAFSNCWQITSIEMPDSLKKIGTRAFNNCVYLPEIEIPENVTYINNYAFYNCVSLKILDFNAKSCSYNYNTFYNVYFTTLNIGRNVSEYPDVVTIETVTFAEGITEIRTSAFYNYDSLTTVNLPNSLTYIGIRAFRDCDSLESITIPENVTGIDWDAFDNCDKLETVNFNAFDCSVSYDAFNYCPIKTLNIGPGVNRIPYFDTLETATFSEGALRVPDYAFSGCGNLKTVTLPETITYIGDSAFYDCYLLSDIEIPENVAYIGSNAFHDCDYLDNIIIPENVTYIGYGAFSNCHNLETVTFRAMGDEISYGTFYGSPVKTLYVGANVVKLPDIDTLETVTFEDGTTKIPDNAFMSCSSLTTVNLPDSVEEIGDGAFKYCTALESIDLSANIKAIGTSAFFACYALTDADLPDGIETIGNGAFDNCINLSEINIPDSVKTIGKYAFYGCVLATEVTVPENVESIGYAAFGSCYAIESVEFNAVDCAIESNEIFYGCDNISSVTIGEGVTAIPFKFMYGKTNITSVEIPSSVKDIGAFAFSGTSLTEIDLPEGIENIRNNAFADIATAISVTIPESVESIAVFAFSDLPILTEINFNAVNAQVSNQYDYYYNYDGGYGDPIDHVYENDGVFSGSGYQSNGITVNFGESVETIPAKMFEPDYDSQTANIKNVVIGSNVKEIGQRAFCYCDTIENIEFGSKVETIGGYAFYGCTNIRELNFPESLKTIGASAFGNCEELTTLTIPEGVEFIDDHAFCACTGITTINYNAVDTDCGYAFNCCEGVKTVNIGDEVESIYAYAFTGCNNLEKVYVPDIVIYIDPLAFDGCGNVSIVCKNGSYANVYAVQNGLKYVLEDNATGTAFEIRNDMLLGYSGSARNIVLPSDINSIGIDAFKDSNVVKAIEVPYNVSKIYSGAFANCPNLERVIIPFTVTDISDSAFTGTDVTIYCYYNSYAYNYAVANNIKYELITVTLSTNTVNIVETEAVTVNAAPSVTLASGVPLVWRSNNPSIASVDSTGKIVGNSVGETQVGIYDINGNLLDECSVIVEEMAEIVFEDVSTDTLKYGEKIILHINIADLPEGASVKWETSDSGVLKISNENAMCGDHENCVTCTVESVGNGSAEITGTVVDKNGNPIIQNGEEIKVSYELESKASFFWKIIAFFKKIFGLLKIYPQAY